MPGLGSDGSQTQRARRPWLAYASFLVCGPGLLDNAPLRPLAKVCKNAGGWEFAPTTSPLLMVGGRGSPVDPAATLPLENREPQRLSV